MDVQRFFTLRKTIMDGFFSHLNPPQRQAVYAVDGPVLILAGAGSGKTTVLIHRIACMLQFGNAYHSAFVPQDLTDDDLEFLQEYADGENWDMDKAFPLIAHNPVAPWNILAITFTNKAAAELRERLEKLLGESGRQVHAYTFHSACSRILRREIQHLGFTSDFTIYDTDDSLRVLKSVLTELGLSEKTLNPRAILSAMGNAKDRMLSPIQFAAQPEVSRDYFLKLVSQIYPLYQQRLKQANALDFDDILYYTVLLFRQHPDVLEQYRKRYPYVLVDEYQDTNQVQFALVHLLCAGHNNICVVGDDDQSIYKFRGATIENILSFEQTFPNAQVIRLEQNYRSTKTILEAANHLIGHNIARKGKKLWTQNDAGSPVSIVSTADETAEARFITNQISDNVAQGQPYRSHVILYRLNAQSQALERGCAAAGIPYRIIGSLRFFDRKEVKDMLAYLTVLHNPRDSLRLSRIINEPKRGIGSGTLEKLLETALAEDLSPLDVMQNSENYPSLRPKAKTLSSLANLFFSWQERLSQVSLEDLLEMVLDESGYRDMLKEDQGRGQTRLENILELGTTLRRFSQQHDDPTLAAYLEEVSLFTELDRYDQSEDAVVLMTIHAAKGLEFDHVFVAGAEDDLFPGFKSASDPALLEEERRLAYVCVTRAKKDLTFTLAAQRMLYGRTMRGIPSRFLSEIPPELCLSIENRPSYSYSSRSFDDPPQNTFSSSSASSRRYGGPSTFRSGDTSSRFADASKRYSDASTARSSSLHPTASSTAAVPKPDPCSLYLPGMQVRHKVFGDGTILSVTPLSGDALLEIAFTEKGTKRIMATYAPLTILSQP